MAYDSPIDHLIDVALGKAEPLPDDVERRGLRRNSFEGLLALVQWTPSGGKSITTTVQCRNVCPGGMCLVSSYMLHVGHEGVVLARRSNGDHVMLGIRIAHCRYVGSMTHESGGEIVNVPKSFSLEDFEDDQGSLPDLCLAA